MRLSMRAFRQCVAPCRADAGRPGPGVALGVPLGVALGVVIGVPPAWLFGVVIGVPHGVALGVPPDVAPGRAGAPGVAW